jgi:hypothetical protein
MLVSRIALGFAVAAAAAFAPGAAQASFPISTCDTVQCFAAWCANNARDCTDGEPLWYHCEPSRGCFGGSGDITRYVAYCAVINPPTTCLK